MTRPLAPVVLSEAEQVLDALAGACWCQSSNADLIAQKMQTLKDFNRLSTGKSNGSGGMFHCTACHVNVNKTYALDEPASAAAGRNVWLLQCGRCRATHPKETP